MILPQIAIVLSSRNPAREANVEILIFPEVTYLGYVPLESGLDLSDYSHLQVRIKYSSIWNVMMQNNNHMFSTAFENSKACRIVSKCENNS